MSISDHRGESKSGEELSKAISAYRDLAGFGGDESDSVNEVGVELPLALILKQIPEAYTDRGASSDSDRKVFIGIPDLLEQLKKGRVSLPLASLAGCLPATALKAEAFEDTVTMVNLPLPDVVKAVDPALLKGGAQSKDVGGKYNLASLRDPFKRAKVPETAPGGSVPSVPPPPPPPPPTPLSVPPAAMEVPPPPPPPPPVEVKAAPPPPPPAAVVPPVKPPVPIPVPVAVTPPTPVPPKPVEPVQEKVTPPAPIIPPAPVVIPPVSVAPPIPSAKPVPPPSMPPIPVVEKPAPVVPAPVPEAVKPVEPIKAEPIVVPAPVAAPEPVPVVVQAPAPAPVPKPLVVTPVETPAPVKPIAPEPKIADPVAPVSAPMPLAPPVAASVKEPEPVKEPAKAVAPTHVPPSDVATEAAPTARREAAPPIRTPTFTGTQIPEYEALPVSQEADVETGALGSVNANTADADQLLAIQGMDHELANKIVGERLQHGPFKSIFDLHERVGLSRTVFQKLTGMPYSAQKKHRALKLARKLALPTSKICDLNAIAEAVGKTKGISGCVICDKEGLIVAEHSVGQAAEALSAIAADLIAQASRNMAMVGLNVMSSISISIEGQMFTIAKSGELYVTVVHDANRITGSKLKLIHVTAQEMEWAFSRRVFAG